jgi:hypothetical protein
MPTGSFRKSTSPRLTAISTGPSNSSTRLEGHLRPASEECPFFFDQIPQLYSVVLSIPLYGESGHVSLGYVGPGQHGPPAGEVSVAFPETGAVQWLDVLYAPSDASGKPMTFLLNIEPGNFSLTFTYALLELPSQVVNPPPPSAAP